MTLDAFAKLRERRGDLPIDLFVLSACRTALGDSDSELGFSGLALQAGARSAVGSIWYVDDVATSAFLVQFYRLLERGLSKGQAIMQTRQNLSSGRVRLIGDQLLDPDGEPLLSNLTAVQQQRIRSGLQHPFYWAGINLMGTPW
jgi:CHAT domain-containing protein